MELLEPKVYLFYIVFSSVLLLLLGISVASLS